MEEISRHLVRGRARARVRGRGRVRDRVRVRVGVGVRVRVGVRVGVRVRVRARGARDLAALLRIEDDLVSLLREAEAVELLAVGDVGLAQLVHVRNLPAVE